MTAEDVFKAIGEITRLQRAGDLSEPEAHDQIRETIHRAFAEMPPADLLKMRDALMGIHHGSGSLTRQNHYVN
jgi:hypothetical protein